MSELQKLINELCPDGVEFKKLSEIATVSRGIRVVKKQLETTGDIPVYQNSIKPLGYYEKSNCKSNTTFIIGAGSAGEIGFSPVDFWAADDCYYFICSEKILDRFLYYALLCQYNFIKSQVRKASIPRLERFVIENLKIPAPPLDVQAEIVRILDNFTDYIDCLEKEIELRKKQYEYYSQKLLTNDDSITTFKLSDLCEIKKGKTPIQKAVSGKYPMVVTTTERKSCNNYQFDCSAVCIPLVSSRGHGIASLNHVYYQKGKFALGSILCAVIPKDNKFLNSRYLYYYFELKKDYVLVPLMKGGANVSLHIQDIANVKIPVPPIEEQERIIKILDKFDTLCNDLTNGIPAEINARKKQYEYYRNKLLQFN